MQGMGSHLPSRLITCHRSLGYACGEFSRQMPLLQELGLTVRRLLQCIAKMHLQALQQGHRVDCRLWPAVNV